MAHELLTPSDVFNALGGVGAVARLTGFKYRRVWNWRVRGFPAETHAVMTKALGDRGLSAHPSLWKQVEAAS